MVSLSSAEMDFDIESVLKTIPDFSGKYKELDKFLTIIEYIYNSYSSAAKLQLIDFVIKVKLSQQLRTAIGLVNIPTDFKTLEKSLKARCKSNKCESDIYNSLTTIRQGKKTISQYNDEIIH